MVENYDETIKRVYKQLTTLGMSVMHKGWLLYFLNQVRV